MTYKTIFNLSWK